MAIASTKLVLLRKLFNRNSSECQKLHFHGNFKKILGGRGPLIVHDCCELHLWMLTMPDFYVEIPYQSFHIWYNIRFDSYYKILHSCLWYPKIPEKSQKSRFPWNPGPWPRRCPISVKILIFEGKLTLLYTFGIISLNNWPIYKI